MNEIAKLWKIDRATDLIATENKFAIRWAGCTFPFVKALSEVVEGDLLAQCEDALLREPDTTVEVVHYDHADGTTVTYLI